MLMTIPLHPPELLAIYTRNQRQVNATTGTSAILYACHATRVQTSASGCVFASFSRRRLFEVARNGNASGVSVTRRWVWEDGQCIRVAPWGGSEHGSGASLQACGCGRPSPTPQGHLGTPAAF